MEYKFKEIEKKWQDHWKSSKTYQVSNESAKPKYYVLDMFPYPSGAGLHVGHPLGYIASDIYSRYKRLKGFNVLHPMGFDSFGLPAEQYAIETGQHPAETTKKNIATFKSQLDKIGFCYDWNREVQTSDPHYYKWTQWIFLQLYNSYFCNTQQKARPITDLIKKYETKGCSKFTAEQWNSYSKKEQEDFLMNRRLAFSKYGEVNWCEVLGTVLANDEVVNGVSERGGYPVVKKKMRQWYLRITAYADRLLEGLETVDFSDSMKEMQRNWIGRSEGAEIKFKVKSLKSKVEDLTVYTTRPDTIFGVDFMVVAPEFDWIADIVSEEQRNAVDEYVAYVKSRSDVDRMAEKKITGCFTGAYAINPFDGREIPIWISEYVLAGYGTGAIMAVPCGDERDFKFARHFNIPITNIIGSYYNGEEANPTKEATLENSGFLNGMLMKDAIGAVVKAIEEKGIGIKKVNYKMRDAGFSRQRYWGEPFPIIWEADGVPFALSENDLPLELPHVDKYGPGPEGEGPLANITDWINVPASKASPAGRLEGAKRESSTMPGYAGSSWYFLRYMDPHNNETFCDRKASDYWNQVDLYIGGTEHAVGHLLYSRLWTKVLFDLGLIGYDEPFKRLVNQGMIQGSSRFVYRLLEKGYELLFARGIENNFKAFNFKYQSERSVSSTEFDFVSDEKKIAIELSNQSNIQQKFEHAISLQPQHRLIFISYQEILLQLSKGTETLINWFKNILQSEENYISKQTTNFSLFISEAQLTAFSEGEYSSIHIDVNIVDGTHLDIVKFRNHKEEYQYAVLLLEDGTWLLPDEPINNQVYICGVETEKMSKSKYNTVNPNDLCDKYGADTFRMYEMFLGPVEQSKPWDTKGIEGVHRFLRKLWRLFFDELKGKVWTDAKATDTELKVLHKTIKKIEEDTERFSFNTAVSTFMICVNELADLKCSKKEILEPLVILLAPYAPHIAEELYQQLRSEASPAGRLEGAASVLDATYPTYNPALLVESSKEYPVSINGKVRTNINLALDLEKSEVEKLVLQNEIVQKWLEGKSPKNIIYVKNKMVNVVV